MGLIEQVTAVYLLNSLWQIPMIYAAGWLTIRLLHSAESKTHHRVWVATLLLQAILPATDLSRMRLLLLSPDQSSGSSAGVSTHIGPAAMTAMRVIHLPPIALRLILLAYALTVLASTASLIRTLSRTRAIERNAEPLLLQGPAKESCFYLNMIPPARLGTSALIAGPVALGIVRPLILFPLHLVDALDSFDLEAVMAHEIAHIRRHDFLKNLVYEIVTLPIAFHPVLRLTRARISETRELVCDQDAASVLIGNKPYAHSLLRLAALLTANPPAKTHHALGIAEANIFERRIMKLTQTPIHTSMPRRILLASTAAVLAVATCTSASALRLRIAPPTGVLQNAIKVAAGDMQAAEKKQPVYPAEAKANHDTVDGPVVLSVHIGKDGLVRELHVQKSLRPDYDASALEAVKDWHWTPYLLNGEPTEVETTVTVTYSSNN